MRHSKLPAPGPFPEVPLRILALADAVLFPALGLYWIWSRPGKGSLVGAAMATLLVWWGIKRGARALLAFDDYRWITRHLVRLALVGYLLLGLRWLFSHWT